MRDTNKGIFKKAAEAQRLKLGCYDDMMQTLHSYQVSQVLSEIEFGDTRDVKFNYCVVEIEVIDGELDLHYLTKEEYAERYGE